MKKIIILIILSFFTISNTYASMYFLDGYYIGKIKGYNLQNKTIQFENYINFYDYNNPFRDFISGQYRKYIFSKGFLWNKNDIGFVEKNKNEEYAIFYINNYVENFLDIFKKEDIPILYIGFIKCDKKGKIYFDTNGKEIFPMLGTKKDEKYVRKKLGKLNYCKELENFFKTDKRFNFGLEKQIDFRIYYLLFFIILVSSIVFLMILIKKLGKKIYIYDNLGRKI